MFLDSLFKVLPGAAIGLGMLIEFTDTYNEAKCNVAAGVGNTGVASKALRRIHRSISRDAKTGATLNFKNSIEEDFMEHDFDTVAGGSGSTRTSVEEEELENLVPAEAFAEEIENAGWLAVMAEKAKHGRPVTAEASAAESVDPAEDEVLS